MMLVDNTYTHTLSTTTTTATTTTTRTRATQSKRQTSSGQASALVPLVLWYSQMANPSKSRFLLFLLYSLLHNTTHRRQTPLLNYSIHPHCRRRQAAAKRWSMYAHKIDRSNRMKTSLGQATTIAISNSSRLKMHTADFGREVENSKKPREEYNSSRLNLNHPL